MGKLTKPFKSALQSLEEIVESGGSVFAIFQWARELDAHSHEGCGLMRGTLEHRDILDRIETLHVAIQRRRVLTQLRSAPEDWARTFLTLAVGLLAVWLGSAGLEGGDEPAESSLRWILICTGMVAFWIALARLVGSLISLGVLKGTAEKLKLVLVRI